MIATILLAVLFAQGSPTGLPAPHSRESFELRTTLQRRVENYRVDAGNFVDALIEVAGRFNVPMGIEWVRTPSEMEPVHFLWKHATVQKVVEDVVHATPGYEIRITNAVVHVKSRGLVPNQQNFLRLKIPEFEVRDQVAEIASRRLNEFVSLKVTPPKPAPPGQLGGGVVGSQLGEVGDPKISVILTDVSAEDVLDAITLASPFKVWLVTFDEDSSPTPGGFRRTVLASGKAVSDEYQPVWELLKWGRKPY